MPPPSGPAPPRAHSAWPKRTPDRHRRMSGCDRTRAARSFDGGDVVRLTEAVLLCYIAIMRAGRTKTTSFSLDDATLKNLKALALRRHKGNVSALLAEFAEREAKFLAAERLFEKYGIPPLSDESAEKIEAEWRGEGKKKRRAA